MRISHRAPSLHPSCASEHTLHDFESPTIVTPRPATGLDKPRGQTYHPLRNGKTIELVRHV